jgi:hypothetical protein
MSIKKYTYEDQEKIKNLIDNIKKKDVLEKIRDIIKKHNPKSKFTVNNNGIFITFNNLENITYFEIEKLIKNTNSNGNISETSETEIKDSISDNKLKNVKNDDIQNKLSESDDYTKTKKKYSHAYDESALETTEKYNNKERNIIKRIKYEEIINNEISENKKYKNNSDKEQKKKEKYKKVIEKRKLNTIFC